MSWKGEPNRFRHKIKAQFLWCSKFTNTTEPFMRLSTWDCSKLYFPLHYRPVCATCRKENTISFISCFLCDNWCKKHKPACTIYFMRMTVRIIAMSNPLELHSPPHFSLMHDNCQGDKQAVSVPRVRRSSGTNLNMFLFFLYKYSFSRVVTEHFKGGRHSHTLRGNWFLCHINMSCIDNLSFHSNKKVGLFSKYDLSTDILAERWVNACLSYTREFPL